MKQLCGWEQETKQKKALGSGIRDFHLITPIGMQENQIQINPNWKIVFTCGLQKDGMIQIVLGPNVQLFARLFFLVLRLYTAVSRFYEVTKM